MQTDGYSLDAQKARMKAFAGYNDYEVIVKLAGNPKFAAYEKLILMSAFIRCMIR